jgi:hypothetical protein
MRAGPSEPPFRRRLQTAPGCCVEIFPNGVEIASDSDALG